MSKSRMRMPRTALTVAALSTIAVGGLALPAHAVSGHAYIVYGNSGYGVKCVQEGIDDWSNRVHHTWPLTVDGQFGSNTLTYLKKFQAASHLTADGVVGPATANAITDNLTGDGNWRSSCYTSLPSTYK
ncbi:peptidoglycan-binding domain-containing protein [Streptomyces sp. NPDC046985]|uniref:peptidoglycan-binding domain-containing protein n=1 Tax=Streptomyces sp. NPDC046985 TaxID=3155377 RepID=UPI003408DCC6